MSTPIFDSVVADLGIDFDEIAARPLFDFNEAISRITSATTYKKKMRAERARIAKEAKEEQP